MNETQNNITRNGQKQDNTSTKQTIKNKPQNTKASKANKQRHNTHHTNMAI